jgi:hypothetical protein
MSRLIAALVFSGMIALTAAADPGPVEKQLAIQSAMGTAQQFLKVEMPGKAVEALEAELPNADGNKNYLALLKQCYLAELGQLMKDPAANEARIKQVRRCLDLMTGGAPMPVVAAAPPAIPVVQPSLRIDDPIADPDPNAATTASAAFKKGDYVQAERLFSSCAATLNADQKAAWAYCRIRLAAEKVNGPACDAAAAAAIEKDVREALKLAPNHSELQRIGQDVIAAASLKTNGRDAASSADAAGACVETPSFRVRYSGNRELAEQVAKNAESSRKHVYERWSGPPGGAWEPKCEIVIHATAEAFARATKRPAGTTGTATVRLSDGRAQERRIDLRADDAGMVSNALPRELTHVVLADLFPDKSPPRWAEEGMAVLAGSPEEAGRFRSTLPRCVRDGEWYGLAQLMEMKEYPADKITGYYCESVSLTDYLIRLRGERDFTIFLRDCQRYGTPQALKRQYGIEGIPALESAWKRSALEVSRGQAP